MTMRTSARTVTFEAPFVLGDADEVLPAGAYVVETDEERIEGLSFVAYRRLATLFNVPAPSGHAGSARVLTIDPADLEAALRRDRPAAGPGEGEATPPQPR